MIVISENAYLSIEIEDLNKPVVGIDNKVSTSNVTATGSATDYPITNIANPATFLYWKANSTASKTITINLTGNTDLIDYVGIAKHNFYDDVWEYRRKVRGIQGGRWYAMPGEGGLITCTFPRGGAENAAGKGKDSWAAAYFNACMSGFEYQAAANMIAEGLVEQGLSVVKRIHERYSARNRNPYNEVECSDHYGRAMASFGAYIALTGMQIDSPNHIVQIAPKINGGKARCAFVDAHGWGTIDNRSGKTVRRYLHMA